MSLNEIAEVSDDLPAAGGHINMDDRVRNELAAMRATRPGEDCVQFSVEKRDIGDALDIPVAPCAEGNPEATVDRIPDLSIFEIREVFPFV
jgi:hypothetical protein